MSSSALIEVRSWHGATTPTSEISIANQVLRMKDADLDAPLDSVTDGFVIPEIGVTGLFSYVKNFRCYATSPVVRFATDIQVYFKERPVSWDGVEVFIKTSSSYLDPIYEGTAPLSGFVDNAGSYTEASPLIVPGQLTAGQSGHFGNYIWVQVRVTDQSTPGITLPFPFVVKWKEWA